MARVTYFVVLPFSPDEDGAIVAGEGMPAQSAGGAVRQAERVAADKGGAVAFSRTGDPDIGEFEPAVVLARFGNVPEDLPSYVD
jgi:hypothetical protein